MNGIVKKKLVYDKNSDTTQLLSLELLGSLLNRFKLVMDEKYKKQNNHLRKFLLEKNLNYFQDLQVDEIQNVTQLSCYFNLPLNIFKETPIVSPANILQLMLDTKKHKLGDNEFVMNMWNLLKK